MNLRWTFYKITIWGFQTQTWSHKLRPLEREEVQKLKWSCGVFPQTVLLCYQKKTVSKWPTATDPIWPLMATQIVASSMVIISTSAWASVLVGWWCRALCFLYEHHHPWTTKTSHSQSDVFPEKKKQKIEETWLVLADGDTSNTQPPVLWEQSHATDLSALCEARLGTQ